MKLRKFIYINVFLSGILSIFIYILLREDNYIKILLKLFPFLINIKTFMLISINTNTILGYIIKYSLGDLLWAYALNMSLYLNFKNFLKTTIISISVCFIFELVQISNFVVGNFDLIDFFCEIIGILISNIVLYIYTKNVDKKQNIYI